MSNVQASLHAFAPETESPAALCTTLNGALCNNIVPGKFVTLFYGVLDSRSKRFIFENAGHCQPIVIRKDGRIDVPSSSSGVLGVFPEWTYEDREISLDVGDCLLLLTDGLIDHQAKMKRNSVLSEWRKCCSAIVIYLPT